MNPFSLPINDSFLYEQRELQRTQKTILDKELRLIPVYDRSPQNKISIISELRKSIFQSLSPSKATRDTFISNRENIDEFIKRKREILIVKKSIENKKQNLGMLEFNISQKEKFQRDTLKELEDHLHRVEKYEENLMIEAKKKAENTNAKIKQRNDIQNKCNKLTEEIEVLQLMHNRKKEELRKLEVNKEFLEMVARSNNADQGNLFLTQDSLLLKNPAYITDSIDALESNNLFQVRLFQEADNELEKIKSENLLLENQMQKRNEEVLNKIKILEKQKENAVLKLKKLTKPQTEDFSINKKTLAEINKRLVELVNIIGAELNSFPTELDMLEIVEKAFDDKIKQTKSMDSNLFKEYEEKVRAARRNEERRIQILKEAKKNANLNESLHKIRHNAVKKLGRKAMPRTKINEKKIINEKQGIPQEALDRIEFLEE